jgi:hypothetical protein
MMFTGTPSRPSSTSMPQLMRGKPATDTRLSGERRQFAAHSSRGPRAATGRAVEDAEQRPDRQLDALLEPKRVTCSNPRSSIPTSRRLSFFPCLINNDPRR